MALIKIDGLALNNLKPSLDKIESVEGFALNHSFAIGKNIKEIVKARGLLDKERVKIALRWMEVFIQKEIELIKYDPEKESKEKKIRDRYAGTLPQDCFTKYNDEYLRYLESGEADVEIEIKQISLKTIKEKYKNQQGQEVDFQIPPIVFEHLGFMFTD